MKNVLSIIPALLLALAGAVGQTTLQVNYVFDDLDRIVQENWPDGTVIQYAWDKTGNRSLHHIAPPAAPPDLMPQNAVIAGGNAVGAGAVLALGFTLQNAGVLTAGACKTKFYLHTANALAGATLLDSLPHSNIPAGGISVSKNLAIPAGTAPGNYFLLLRADANGTVAESNETNNLAGLAVTVAACGSLLLTVGPVTAASCGQPNGSATAALSGGNGPVSWLWNTQPAQTAPTASGLLPGNHAVTATDALGCSASAVASVGNVGTPPSSLFSVGSAVGLTVGFVNESTGGPVSHTWNFGSGATSNAVSPTHAFPVEGVHNICLTAENACGNDVFCQSMTLSSGCGTPSGISAAALSTTSATMGWGLVPGADSFALRYRPVSATAWQTVFSTTNQRTLQNLSPGETYACQIRSACGPGVFSAWSETAYFALNDPGYFVYDKFWRTYNNYLADCSQIEPLASGGFALLGKKLNDDVSLLLRIDAEGNLVWEREIGFGNIANISNAGLKETPDGGLMGCFWYAASSGRYVFVAKFSGANGQTLWSKQILNEMDNFVAFNTDNTGNGLLTYYFTLSGPRRLYSLIKINGGNGNVAWSRQFEKSGTTATPFIGFVRANDAGNIFVGGGFQTGASVGYFISKYSPAGVMLWKKIFNESGNSANSIVDIDFDAQGNIYFVATKQQSQPYIIYGKLNSSGQNLWLHSAGDIRAHRILLKNNALYILGDHFNYSPLAYLNGICVKTDTAGNILSSYMVKKDPNDGYQWEISNFNDATFDPSGNLWIAGRLANPNNIAGGAYSMGLIKTDQNVQWICRTQNAGFGTAGGGTFSEWSNTIVSDTLVLQSYGPATLTNVAVAHQDSVVCASGCNVLASVLAENDSVCVASPLHLIFNGANATSFVWTDLATGDTLATVPNPVLSFDAPGLRNIVLKAASAMCSRRDTLQIVVLENPGVSFSALGPACPDAQDGEASVQVSGGLAPYEVLWSNGSTSVSIENLGPGVFAATATDAAGCSASGIFEMTAVQELPLADFLDSTWHLTAWFENTSQQADGFFWDFGDGTTAAAASPEHVFSAPGDYNVCLLAINPCDTAQFCSTVSVSSCLRYADADGDSFGNVNADTVACSTPAGYVWNNADCDDFDAFIFPGASETCADGLDNDCDGLADEPLLAVVSGTTNPVCNGYATGAVNVSVSCGLAPYSFFWSNGATTEDLAGVPAGIYTVQITDAQGLTKTMSATLTQPTGISLTYTAVKPTCPDGSNGSLRVNHSGGTYTYVWSNGGTTKTISGIPAGAYSVTVRNAATTCTTVGTTTLAQPLPVTLAFTVVNNKCFGQSIGTATAAATGGTGGKTYVWSTGAAGTTKIIGLPAGQYSATATDSKGCTGSGMATVTQPTEVVLAALVEAIAGNKYKITLSATGGTPYATGLSHRYCKVSATGACSFNSTVSFTNIAPNTALTFRARDFNTCTEQISVTTPNTQSAPGEDRSVAAAFENLQFSLSPNPFREKLEVLASGPLPEAETVFVHDAKGRLLKTLLWPPGTDKIQVDLGDQPPGVYWLKIGQGRGAVRADFRAVKME